MSDEIVKSLLESLTPEQKQDLIDKILNSNVKGSESKPEPKKDEVSVTEDFKVVSNSKLESKRKQPVRYKKNTWSDDGEFRDEQVDYEKFEIAFIKFKELCDKKKYVFDEDIEALINEEFVRSGDYYKLVSLSCSSGTENDPSAELTLLADEESITISESGDGPIDSVFKAICKAVGVDPKLDSYNVASVTGGMVALVDAINGLQRDGFLTDDPLIGFVAAVSVGIYKGQPVLDLDYLEDSGADSDLNLVVAEGSKLIEIQGTAEKAPFSRAELNALLDLGEIGILQLISAQKAALAEG